MVDLSRFLDALLRLYPAATRANVRAILIPGVGQCIECGEILKLFPSAHLTLLDLDMEALAQAQATTASFVGRVQIVVGDIGNIAQLAPGPYDLVVIRHPDVDRHPASWRAGLRACSRELAADGLLVATAYSTAEAAFIEQTMQTLPMIERREILFSAIPVALAGNDRYILVYGKTEPS